MDDSWKMATSISGFMWEHPFDLLKINSLEKFNFKRKAIFNCKKIPQILVPVTRFSCQYEKTKKNASREANDKTMSKLLHCLNCI